MLELIAISYSPWSEKARWALDYSGLPYQETPYLSMVGELALRKRLGRWRGKVSVPLLFADGRVIDDSLKIAEHAANKSEGHELFPEEDREKISEWNARSEKGMAAGRALTSQRVLQDPAARREAMPPMPKVLIRPLTAPLTRLAVAFLRRKYGYGEETESQERTLSEMLAHLSDTLSDGRPYILGDNFSYADICMAAMMQFVRPVTNEYIKLGSASRRTWTSAALAQEYSQLLQWRDQVYESHRRS